MNTSTYNSSVFNGASGVSGVVKAVAAIACAASFTAHATRIQDALAPTYSAAYFDAQGTVTRYVESNVIGTSELYNKPTHTKQAKALIETDASISVYVLREVNGIADLGGRCEIIAIPASTIGKSDVVAGSTLNVEATKIQPGYASIYGDSNVTVNIDPTIYRYVVSQPIAGTANVRVETTINDITEAFADLDSKAILSVQEAGLVKRVAEATFEVTGLFNPVLTYIHNALGNAEAGSLILMGEAHIEHTPTARILVNAEVNPDATRVLVPVVNVNNQATIVSRANVNHGSSKAILVGSSNIHESSYTVRYVKANVLGFTPDVLAKAIRIVKPESDITGEVFTVVNATRNVYGVNDSIPSNVYLSGLADTTIREGSGVFDSYSFVLANSTRLIFPVSELINSTSEVIVEGTRVLIPKADVEFSSEFSSTGLRVALGKVENEYSTANVYCIADTTIRKGIALINPSANINSNPTRITFNHPTTLSTKAEIITYPVRVVLPISDIGVSNELTAKAIRVVKPVSNIEAAAVEFYGIADTTIRPGVADITTVATVDLTPGLITRFAMVEANIDPVIVFNPEAVRTTFAGADIDTHIEIFADTKMNLDSIDPPERTFIRPEQQTTFKRPVQETTFRRFP